MSNKSDSKELILKSVGPFDEQGLKIKFNDRSAKDKGKDKANIHILVGENGSGKSTVLKGLFFASFEDKKKLTVLNERRERFNGRLRRGEEYKTVTENNENFFEGFDINDPQWNFFKDWKDVFYYTPNEPFTKIENYYLPKNELRFLSESNIINWVCYYPIKDYLKYIQNLENNRNTLLVNTHLPEEIGSNRLDVNQTEEIKSIIRLTEVLENFIKKVYDIDFKYRFKNTIEGYQPFLKGEFIEFSQLSLGYRQIISLVTDLLIKIWDISSNKKEREKGHFYLLLDEIDIHLHPKAQRRILPALQELFPNAEIFCTTHSPFVVNSVSDAWVYELSEENYTLEKDGLRVLEGKRTSVFNDYGVVLDADFNTSDKYGEGANDSLNELFKLIEGNPKNITEIEEYVNNIEKSYNLALKDRLKILLASKGINL